MKNFFSIIIPCYNAANTITYCLDSILQSGFTNYEVICVDDCSRDNTVQIIQQYNKVQLVSMEKNQGAAVARNTGVKRAKGDIILFIDSDVLIMQDTLEKMQQSFIANQADAVVGIYSTVHPFKEAASCYKNLHLHYTRKIMNREVSIFDGSFVAIKKQAFEAVSGFDENFVNCSCEDWDLANRLSEKGYRIILDQDITFIHRKFYKVWSMFKTDLWKAFNVMKMMLRRSKNKGLLKSKTAGSFPLSMILSQFIVFLFVPLLLFSWMNVKLAAGCFILLVLIFYLVNSKYFQFMRKEKNTPFMFTAMGIHFLYLWALIIGFSTGLLDYYLFKHRY